MSGYKTHEDYVYSKKFPWWAIRVFPKLVMLHDRPLLPSIVLRSYQDLIYLKIEYTSIWGIIYRSTQFFEMNLMVRVPSHQNWLDDSSIIDRSDQIDQIDRLQNFLMRSNLPESMVLCISSSQKNFGIFWSCQSRNRYIDYRYLITVIKFFDQIWYDYF